MGNNLKKDYIPTVFEDYIVDVNFGKKKTPVKNPRYRGSRRLRPPPSTFL